MRFHSFFAFIFALIYLFSCKTNVKSDEKNPSSKINSTEENSSPDSTINEEIKTDNFNLDTLKGMYIGDFGGNDIRIVINYLSEKHAVGYNILKGLQRNISGKLEENENEINLELHEPGDHEYDGIFFIKFSKSDLACSGYWKSNSAKISEKKFKLKKIIHDKKILNIDNLKLADINIDNFTQVFYHVKDYDNSPEGDLYFFQDGFCKYDYYPNQSEENSERVEQIETIKGSWTLSKDKSVVVSWAKNNLFPSRKITFKIVIEPNYNFYLLSSDSRKFYNPEMF